MRSCLQVQIQMKMLSYIKLLGMKPQLCDGGFEENASSAALGCSCCSQLGLLWHQEL